MAPIRCRGHVAEHQGVYQVGFFDIKLRRKHITQTTFFRLQQRA
ncbi:hypothetical protein SABIM44S_00576 [Streptomyces abikoensis]